MFTRFRTTRARLQVSLVETRRVDGKVRHEHVASLGSVPLRPAVMDRIGFWQQLHERLAKLSNRIDATMQGAILSAAHARIPMVTADEQRQVQRENAQHDANLWSALDEMNGADALSHRIFADAAGRRAADSEARAEAAKENAAAANERLAKLERGEDVPGGLGQQVDVETILRAEGWSASDLRQLRKVGELSESDFETVLLPRLKQARERAEHRIVNVVWRRSMKNE